MDAIVETVLQYYPDMEGLYLFGSEVSPQGLPPEDLDLAILFPGKTCRAAGNLAMSQCRFALERRLGRTVDLVNLRLAHTVFQNEILQTGKLLFQVPGPAVGWFEMHTLSLYQNLADERRPIIEALYGPKENTHE